MAASHDCASDPAKSVMEGAREMCLALVLQSQKMLLAMQLLLLEVDRQRRWLQLLMDGSPLHCPCRT